MPRSIQEPVTVQNDQPHKESTTTHPAYAQIRASRVSGGAMLYGSDFQHQHYITIEVKKSELQRNLSNNHYYAHESLIELAMSEAQWASFVSSLNMGTGVPCTLDTVNGVWVPALPRPKSQKQQFQREAELAAQEGLARVKALQAEVSEMKISQKAKDDLTKKLGHVSASFTASMPFILDQFNEHMETTVEKAKIEIEAHATNMIMQTGLAALKNGTQPKILGYDDGITLELPGDQV